MNFETIKTKVFLKKAGIDFDEKKKRVLNVPRYDFYTWGCNDEKKRETQTVLYEEKFGIIDRNFYDVTTIETKSFKPPKNSVSKNNIIFEKGVQKTRKGYDDVIILNWTFFDGRKYAKKLGNLRYEIDIPSKFSIRIDAHDYPFYDIKSYQKMVLKDIEYVLEHRQNGFDFAKEYPVIWNIEGNLEIFEISDRQFFRPPREQNRQYMLKPLEDKKTKTF